MLLLTTNQQWYIFYRWKHDFILTLTLKSGSGGSTNSSHKRGGTTWTGIKCQTARGWPVTLD